MVKKYLSAMGIFSIAMFISAIVLLIFESAFYSIVMGREFGEILYFPTGDKELIGMLLFLGYAIVTVLFPGIWFFSRDKSLRVVFIVSFATSCGSLAGFHLLIIGVSVTTPFNINMLNVYLPAFCVNFVSCVASLLWWAKV